MNQILNNDKLSFGKKDINSVSLPILEEVEEGEIVPFKASSDIEEGEIEDEDFDGNIKKLKTSSLGVVSKGKTSSYRVKKLLEKRKLTVKKHENIWVTVDKNNLYKGPGFDDLLKLTKSMKYVKPSTKKYSNIEFQKTKVESNAGISPPTKSTYFKLPDSFSKPKVKIPVDKYDKTKVLPFFKPVGHELTNSLSNQNAEYRQFSRSSVPFEEHLPTTYIKPKQTTYLQKSDSETTSKFSRHRHPGSSIKHYNFLNYETTKQGSKHQNLASYGDFTNKFFGMQNKRPFCYFRKRPLYAEHPLVNKIEPPLPRTSSTSQILRPSSFNDRQKHSVHKADSLSSYSGCTTALPPLASRHVSVNQSSRFTRTIGVKNPSNDSLEPVERVSSTKTAVHDTFMKNDAVITEQDRLTEQPLTTKESHRHPAKRIKSWDLNVDTVDCLLATSAVSSVLAEDKVVEPPESDYKRRNLSQISPVIITLDETDSSSDEGVLVSSQYSITDHISQMNALIKEKENTKNIVRVNAVTNRDNFEPSVQDTLIDILKKKTEKLKIICETQVNVVASTKKKLKDLLKKKKEAAALCLEKHTKLKELRKELSIYETALASATKLYNKQKEEADEAKKSFALQTHLKFQYCKEYEAERSLLENAVRRRAQHAQEQRQGSTEGASGGPARVPLEGGEAGSQSVVIERTSGIGVHETKAEHCATTSALLKNMEDPFSPFLSLLPQRALSIMKHGPVNGPLAQESFPLTTSGRVVVQPSSTRRGYQSYWTPLVWFRSYRFSPYYRTKSKFSLSSLTFSNRLSPDSVLCEHDLIGACNDANCVYTHISDMKMSNHELFQDLLSYDTPQLNEKQLKEKAIKLQSQYAAITANEIALLIVYELNTRDKRNPIGQFVRRSPREFTFKKSKPFKEAPFSPAARSRATLVVTDSNEFINFVPQQPASLRYYSSFSEPMDYEELVKKEPYNVNLWKEYAQHYYGKHERFFTERLQHALHIVSRALEFNKKSEELWKLYIQYCQVYYSEKLKRKSRSFIDDQKHDIICGEKKVLVDYEKELEEKFELALEQIPTSALLWMKFLHSQKKFQNKLELLNRILPSFTEFSLNNRYPLSSKNLLNFLLMAVHTFLMSGRRHEGLVLFRTFIRMYGPPSCAYESLNNDSGALEGEGTFGGVDFVFVMTHAGTHFGALLLEDYMLLWLYYIHALSFDNVIEAVYLLEERPRSRGALWIPEYLENERCSLYNWNMFGAFEFRSSAHLMKDSDLPATVKTAFQDCFRICQSYACIKPTENLNQYFSVLNFLYIEFQIKVLKNPVLGYFWEADIHTSSTSLKTPPTLNLGEPAFPVNSLAWIYLFELSKTFMTGQELLKMSLFILNSCVTAWELKLRIYCSLAKHFFCKAQFTFALEEIYKAAHLFVDGMPSNDFKGGSEERCTFINSIFGQLLNVEDCHMEPTYSFAVWLDTSVCRTNVYMWLCYILFLRLTKRSSASILETFEAAVSALNFNDEVNFKSVILLSYLEYACDVLRTTNDPHAALDDVIKLANRCLTEVGLHKITTELLNLICKELPRITCIEERVDYGFHVEVVDVLLASLPEFYWLSIFEGVFSKFPLCSAFRVLAGYYYLINNNEKSCRDILEEFLKSTSHPSLPIFQILSSLFMRAGLVESARNIYLLGLRMFPLSFSLWKEYYEFEVNSEEVKKRVENEASSLGILLHVNT